MRALSNLNQKLDGKVALLRVDFNVPMRGNEISDYSRIHSACESIDFLLSRNAKVILISHFSRPENQKESQVSLSLSFLVPELKRILGKPVHFAAISSEAKQTVKNMRAREVLLLENVRFYEGEEENDTNFAKKLAELGDIYVNDAFSLSLIHI